MYKKLSIMSLLTLMLIFLLTPIPQSLSQTTNIYINPQQTIAQMGETFSININIAQVTNLAAWEIKLYYLKAILNGTKATEGPFLKTAGSTFFWVVSFTDNYNTTHGRIHITCTLTGTGPGATGSGTLATITFKAKNGGNTPLTLKDTKLLDNQDPPQQIPHTTTNGNVQVTGIRNIAITNITPIKTIVCQGYTMNINVTVANQGDYAETFNVTLYANTTTIQTKEITIQNGTLTTLTYTWNTTGFAKGNYTIWAYAWPVPGETDTSDNTFIDSWVKVVMIGDIYADGKVDMKDVALVSKAFGSVYTPGRGYMHPTPCSMCPHTPNADINNDLRIDMKDVAMVSKQFGKTDP